MHTLRTRLQIIPQEPVLYNETIRFITAGLEVVDDREIWDALEQTGLKEFVSSLELKLETEITNGMNFSFLNCRRIELFVWTAATSLPDFSDLG